MVLKKYILSEVVLGWAGEEEGTVSTGAECAQILLPHSGGRLV